MLTLTGTGQTTQNPACYPSLTGDACERIRDNTCSICLLGIMRRPAGEDSTECLVCCTACRTIRQGRCGRDNSRTGVTPGMAVLRWTMRPSGYEQVTVGLEGQMAQLKIRCQTPTPDESSHANQPLTLYLTVFI